MNPIQKAFGPVRAEEDLKENAVSFLQKEIARRQKHKSHVRAWAAACAAIVLVAAGFLFYGLYTTPVSYISVDVNPSIELELNVFDRVIAFEGYNEDGAAIAETLDLYNLSYTQAVETILSNDAMEDCLAKDGAKLVFTVSSDSGKEEELTAGIESCQGYAENHGTCHSAQSETVHEAHEAGLSTGRYQLYQQLLQAGVSITPEECSHMSMKELMQLLQDASGNTSSDSSSSVSESTSSAVSSSPHHHEEEEEKGHQWGKNENGNHHS